VQYLKLHHFVFDLGLKPSELVVLIYLLKFGSRCWPSHDNIANSTCQSVRTVKRALASLNSRGLVSWQSGYTGRSNRYFVQLPTPTIEAKVTAKSCSGSSVPDFGDIPNATIEDPHLISGNEFSNSADFFKEMGLGPESEVNNECT